MAINLSDLPPKYQQQAVEKYMKQQKRRGPAPPAAAVQNTDRAAKYRNTPHRAGHRLRGRSPL